MFIPGFVITIVTFPGFVMQTVARRFWCDLLGVRVYEAHYFKGTIVHERIDGPMRAALVAFAPFFLNTILCAVLFFPVAFPFLLESNHPYQGAVLAWAGISIGMHALPSHATVNFYLDNLPEHARRGWVYSCVRVAGCFFIVAHYLKGAWIDLVYALVVGMAAPYLITLAFMAH